MKDILPVIAGLAVGIGFIFTLGAMQAVPLTSIDAISARQQHDDWLAQTAYRLDEVRAFREKFPQVGATGYSSSDSRGMTICYTAPPIPCEHENNDMITAYLEVTMNENGQPLSFTIYCDSGKDVDVLTGVQIDVKIFLQTAPHCPK